MRVSLARAAEVPRPDADHGRHAVTLALLPTGRARRRRRRGGAARAAARVVEGGRRAGGTVAGAGGDGGRPGVEVDAVKVADDGSGDIVVRLHEATGNRVAATVALVRRIAAAAGCDLLEQPQRHFEVSDGICAVTLRPFQLMTLRLTPDRRSIWAAFGPFLDLGGRRCGSTGRGRPSTPATSPTAPRASMAAWS